MLKEKDLDNNFIKTDKLPINIKEGSTYIIEQPNPNRYTHVYFKYPCKFIPEIPRWAILKYAENEEHIIYDPFAGSGTSVLEAVISNHNAYATEIDDIARLLIKVKTTPLSELQQNEMIYIFDDMIKRLSKDDIGPTIPEINNMTHWFPKENVIQLGLLRTLIEEVEDIDIKNFLKVCFISIIRRCSYADDVSPKPYVSSKIKKVPLNPVEEIKNVFERYFEHIKEFSNLNIESKVKILEGDALRVNIDDDKVDLIITSPPYINAFDYGRILRLENLWLGFLTEEQIKKKKKFYVGTENINSKKEKENLDILNKSILLKTYYERISLIDKKRALIVKRFFDDMRLNLMEMYRVLKKGGYYCIIIGDSSIRKIKVESWMVLRDLALDIGYNVETYFSYIIQNPYLRIPRKGRGGKINIDNVLILQK